MEEAETSEEMFFWILLYEGLECLRQHGVVKPSALADTEQAEKRLRSAKAIRELALALPSELRRWAERLETVTDAWFEHRDHDPDPDQR